MADKERVNRLHGLLDRAHQAGIFVDQPFWSELWATMEKEMLERLLALPAEEDEAAFRMRTAINVLRQMRSAIEGAASPKSIEALEKELDLIEGRKMRPIA